MEVAIIRRVLECLERRGVDYAVFGGVALNFHGIGRATEDLDLFVRPTQVNLENLREALRDAFADDAVDEINVEEMLTDYPSFRYYPPGDDDSLYLDVLTRLGELYAFESLEIQDLDFQGLKVRVITPRMLYRMKKDTVRPQDHADAARLREKFDLEG
jgi:predicted nucleotidyltransferase